MGLDSFLASFSRSDLCDGLIDAGKRFGYARVLQLALTTVVFDRGSGSRFRLSVPRRWARPGVVLLVLLCLLFLLAAMGVTFVLTAGQFRKGTSRHHHLEHCAVDYRNQLNEAAMQVFRGSNNPMSVLTVHGLL